MIKVAACIQEGKVCGNGATYPGSTCCTGLQCDGSHCIKPGGKPSLCQTKKLVEPFFNRCNKNMLFKRASLFLLVGCIQAGQVCGNGTAYQNSICCSGLQCDGNHCTSSQGGGKIYSSRKKRRKYVLRKNGISKTL